MQYALAHEAMHTYAFPADVLHEEDGTWSVVFPDLPGCVTWGTTQEEAIVNGQEAATLHLEGLREHGNAIPVPSATSPTQATILVRA